MALDKDRIDQIFQDYLDEINALVVKFEVTANSHPIELLNEIRYIITFMERYFLAENDEDKEVNLEAMEVEMKLAKLRCYKYLCTAVENEYKNFFAKYDGADFSSINNGEFEIDITENHNSAAELLVQARALEEDLDKKMQITEHLLLADTVEEVCEMYHKAYLQSEKVHDLVLEGEKYSHILSTNYKALQAQSEKDSRNTRWGMYVGWIGMAAPFLLPAMKHIILSLLKS